MKVIENNIIPFPGFKAINLFGVVFIRKGQIMDPRTFNHESVHTKQMKELGYVFFYIIYFFEWLIRLFMKGNAYRNISFEKEAYLHDDNMNYLPQRKPYAMWRK